METKQEKKAEVQGTETKRQQSPSSVLKSWKTLLVNLENSGLVNKEDYEKTKEMYKKAFKKYLGEELL